MSIFECKSHKKQVSRAGFTLIELLLAVTLTALVGAGLYRTLTSGVRIWHWLEQHRVASDTMIMFERLAEDCANYAGLPEAGFIGTAESVEFAVHDSAYNWMVPKGKLPEDLSDDDMPLYRVAYSYDRQTGILKRQIFTLLAHRLIRESTMVHNVSVCRFSYVDPNMPETGGRNVLSKIDKCPRAVQVAVTMTDFAGTEKTVTRFFLFPGYMVEKEEGV